MVRAGFSRKAPARCRACHARRRRYENSGFPSQRAVNQKSEINLKSEVLSLKFQRPIQIPSGRSARALDRFGLHEVADRNRGAPNLVVEAAVEANGVGR